MADDDRPDHSDGWVAQWLEVEPLDDVTRRRLVSTALSESAELHTAAAPARRSGPWRWIAAAAAVVVVLVGTLAIVTANGGDDQQQATQDDRTALTPKAAAGAAARNVGDFGDLDDAGNLARLRAALDESSFAGSSTSGPTGAQAAAGDSATSELGTDSTADREAPLALCGLVVPDGGRVIAQGSGTIDGRRAIVALIEAADGARSTDAVLEDPCETRHLGTG